MFEYVITQQSLKHLAQTVYEFCGMDYTSSLMSFEMKITRRLKTLQLSSIDEYMRLLESSRQEMDALVEAITINETYFFREERQLAVYEQKLLPELQRKKQGTIHVWSAACSTGEEPYTLAMLAANIGICTKERITITGSDINTTVLQFAQQATYAKKSLSFRRIEPYWIQKYFNEHDASLTLKKEIRELVTFNAINLTNPYMYAAHLAYDVIFCRNVLIYFDEATTKQVITSFHKILNKGGYLFLGHAEMIPNMKEIGFELINDSGTFYYRKE